MRAHQFQLSRHAFVRTSRRPRWISRSGLRPSRPQCGDGEVVKEDHPALAQHRHAARLRFAHAASGAKHGIGQRLTRGGRDRIFTREPRRRVGSAHGAKRVSIRGADGLGPAGPYAVILAKLYPFLGEPRVRRKIFAGDHFPRYRAWAQVPTCGGPSGTPAMASENARSTDPKTAISRERSARSTIVAPAMEPGSSRPARLMTARSVSTKGASRAIMVRIATCYSRKS
jgi:hypothetical protein